MLLLPNLSLSSPAGIAPVLRLAFCFLLVTACGMTATRGEITWSGDVDPSDPDAWGSSTDAYVGGSGDGQITIDGDSVLLSRNSYLGYQAGSSGRVIVNGDGSQWTNHGSLSVGYEGEGRLSIVDGAEVRVVRITSIAHSASNASKVYFEDGTLSTGRLNGALSGLEGTGEIYTNGLSTDYDLIFDSSHGLTQTIHLNDHTGQDIRIHLEVTGWQSLGTGYSTHSSISISDGIIVPSRGGDIGLGEASRGTVTVSGEGTTWDNRGYQLLVGSRGDGVLHVLEGGHVASGSVFVADWTEGEIVVAGSGSSLSVSSDLVVGYGGKATLSVEGGGTVTSADAKIGMSSTSVADAYVEGTESNWSVSNRLIIGDLGRGGLTVSKGGVVTSGGGSVGNSANSTGSVVVSGSGSLWEVDGELTLGSKGSANLEISNGGTLRSRACKIGTQGQGNPVVRISVSGENSQWIVSDTLYVEYRTDAIITVDQGASIIGSDTFFMNDPRNGARLNMSTGGMLALPGEADVSLADFADLFLSFGATDAIRYWSEDLDDWTPITYATYGIDYTLEYLTTGDLAGYTLLTVGTVPSPVAGDFNGDGIVNLADYTVWRDNLGAADDSAIANAGDGVPGVDAGDYATWKTQFGEQQDSSSTSGITAVPEPTALVMVAGVLVMALRYVDRRPRRA